MPPLGENFYEKISFALNHWFSFSKFIFCSGGGEIRTHDAISDISVFKTDLFNHSSTPPKIRQPRYAGRRGWDLNPRRDFTPLAH